MREKSRNPRFPLFFFPSPIFSPSLGSPRGGKMGFSRGGSKQARFGGKHWENGPGEGLLRDPAWDGNRLPKIPLFWGWRWSWFPPRGKFPSFPWFWGCFPWIWLRLRSRLAAVPLFPGIPGKFLLSIARGRERAWNPAEFRPFSGGIPAFLQEKPQEAAPGSIPSRRIPLNLDFWDCAPPLSRITATPGAN